MYRLLIVDDEELITDGLFDVFSRLMPDKLDVYKAYSGKEALEWMARTRIDIILTDISMPGLSGLELIDEVQGLWPHCKVVFLTGYDNFDYVYRAIQMNNVKYLLKTEGYDKVIETIKTIVDELDNAPIDEQALQLTEEEKYAYELMAQSDFMRHVLQKSKTVCSDVNSLAQEFGQVNIPLDSSEEVYLVLGSLTYPKNKTYTEQTQILNYVRTKWERHFSKQIKSISIVDRYGGLVWFIQTYEGKQPNSERLPDFLEGSLEIIQDECLKFFNLTIQFTLSSGLTNWQSVSSKYASLRQLQQLKLDTRYPSIIKEYHHNKDQSIDGLHSTPKMDILTAHLSANRKEDFFAEFSDLTESLEEASYHQITEVYYSIALVLYVAISQNNLQHRVSDFDKLLKIDRHDSFRSSIQYLEHVADQVFNVKETDDQDRSSKVIDRVCHYIQNHLHEDLSLVRLAEIHYFNPSYLSHLFKQEKGINLSEYIDRYRIRQAKKYLKDPSLKIRDVSERVGYHSAHSFTRFFKKMTGNTPKEYRESL
ncbi:MAG: response regulator [Erysipelothrix sp.]|nr:response regulator [Erysipelothrix sp.]